MLCVKSELFLISFLQSIKTYVSMCLNKFYENDLIVVQVGIWNFSLFGIYYLNGY